MITIFKFVGLALACCIGAKMLAAAVSPAIPVLIIIFIVVGVVTLAVNWSRL